MFKMDSIISQLLLYALPAGFLGSVISWIVSRRDRNNSFIQKLQGSIDLLSEKYTKALNDYVTLQEENAALRTEKTDWIASQKRFEKKIDLLTKKIETLEKRILDYEKISQTGDASLAVVPASDSVLQDKKERVRGLGREEAGAKG